MQRNHHTSSHYTGKYRKEPVKPVAKYIYLRTWSFVEKQTTRRHSYLPRRSLHCALSPPFIVLVPHLVFSHFRPTSRFGSRALRRPPVAAIFKLSTWCYVCRQSEGELSSVALRASDCWHVIGTEQSSELMNSRPAFPPLHLINSSSRRG